MPEKPPKPKNVIDFAKARQDLVKKKEAERLKELGETGPEMELTEPVSGPATPPDDTVRLREELEQPQQPTEQKTIDDVGDAGEYARIMIGESKLMLIEASVSELSRNPLANLQRYSRGTIKQMEMDIRAFGSGLRTREFVRRREKQLRKLRADVARVADAYGAIIASVESPEETRGFLSRIFSRSRSEQPDKDTLEKVRQVRSLFLYLNQGIDTALVEFAK
jgi:hypothetical protein